MHLMESIPNTKKNKRKRKKQKNNKNDNDCNTVVKPECFDGMTNWLNLQKIIESTKEKVPENSKKYKIQSFKKPFKRRRLSNPKGDMPITPKKSENSQFNSKDNNDSGWVSGSDLSPCQSEEKSKQNCSTSENDQNIDPDDLQVLTDILSMDCEMVGTGYNGKDSMLARVSIVNTYGQCVYDTFVKPMEKVTDFRTAVSGVRPSDLKNGKNFTEVQQEVSAMIENRILVGHALKHDFDVLFLSHPRSMIRDTSKYKPFREICDGKTPSLKRLTTTILGADIQSGEHSSIEDAQAAMLLYLRHRRDWERQMHPRWNKRNH